MTIRSDVIIPTPRERAIQHGIALLEERVKTGAANDPSGTQFDARALGEVLAAAVDCALEVESGDRQVQMIPLYEHPTLGIYVTVCHLCGQPLPLESACNSGFHQVPDDLNGARGRPAPSSQVVLGLQAELRAARSAVGEPRSAIVNEVVGWLKERENDMNAAPLDWLAVARKIEERFS